MACGTSDGGHAATAAALADDTETLKVVVTARSRTAGPGAAAPVACGTTSDGVTEGTPPQPLRRRPTPRHQGTVAAASLQLLQVAWRGGTEATTAPALVAAQATDAASPRDGDGVFIQFCVSEVGVCVRVCVCVCSCMCLCVCI